MTFYNNTAVKIFCEDMVAIWSRKMCENHIKESLDNRI